MYLLKLLSLASSPTPVVPGGLQGCMTFPPQSFPQLVFAKINFPPAMRGSCEVPGLFTDCFNLTMMSDSCRMLQGALLWPQLSGHQGRSAQKEPEKAPEEAL